MLSWLLLLLYRETPLVLTATGVPLSQPISRNDAVGGQLQMRRLVLTPIVHSKKSLPSPPQIQLSCRLFRAEGNLGESVALCWFEKLRRAEAPLASIHRNWPTVALGVMSTVARMAARFILISAFLCSFPALATDIVDIIKTNPFLQRMKMFQNISPPPTSSTEKNQEPNIPTGTPNTEDNFDSEYQRWNSSLFYQVDAPTVFEIQFTEGPILSTSTTPPVAQESPNAEKPFEVEDDIFESPGGFPEVDTTTESSIMSSVTATSSKDDEIHSFFGDNEIEKDEEKLTSRFTGVTKAQLATTAPVAPLEFGLSRTFFQGSTYRPMDPHFFKETKTSTRTPSLRDDNQVVQFNGHYSVSGTKHYVDNRVDSDTGSNDNFSPVPATDPFAIEAEMINAEEPKAFGARSFVPFPVRKSEDIQPEAFEEDVSPKSSTQSEMLNGSLIERRETILLGRKMTVELKNKLLHGHDLMAFPGAVIHGDLVRPGFFRRNKAFAAKSEPLNYPPRSADTRRAAIRHKSTLDSEENTFSRTSYKRRSSRGKPIKPDASGTSDDFEFPPSLSESIEMACFSSRKNLAATSVPPSLSRESINKLSCLRLCANSTNCKFVTFSGPMALCALYSVALQEVDVQSSEGHSLHKPRKNVQRCVEAFTERIVQAPQKNPGKEKFESIYKIEERCEKGAQVLFVRSELAPSSETIISTLSERLDVSEDDCVFACLTDVTRTGKKIPCFSALFDPQQNQCLLFSKSATHINVSLETLPTNGNLYEKICVPDLAASQCSGGTPTRRKQHVLLGALRDVHTTSSATDCIVLCISAQERLRFKCLSVMYYPQINSLNCILNDESAQSNPTALASENSVSVEYFGVDDCFGIREIPVDLAEKSKDDHRPTQTREEDSRWRKRIHKVLRKKI
ncbi:unnamed protein product [Caenorhabditis auriculariae]|uniref:Apple domain-containing protein n=1 Tax=Caenorhabditis auriculariae TaxID=2777116 RepID=A0A8S1GMB8_9PELO|nr:unnamed protein product [Caenorhabditis auriculariae]